MQRVNKAFVDTQFNVTDEAENILHFYCEKYRENGGISEAGWTAIVIPILAYQLLINLFSLFR